MDFFPTDSLIILGMNCAPLKADLFRCSCENEFFDRWIDSSRRITEGGKRKPTRKFIL